MTSVRAVLTDAGLVAPHRPIILPGVMGRWPPSGRLRDALRSCRDPQVDQWTEHKRHFKNLDWTRRCQGIATDGSRWFVSSNFRRFPGVYRLDSSMNTIEKKVEIPRSVGGHVGALDVYDGRVYVALEEPAQITVYDLDLNRIELLRTRDRMGRAIEGPGNHFSWCAVDPWNDDLLYTADGFYEVSKLVAFHKATGSLVEDERGGNDGGTGQSTTIMLEQPPVKRNQGGCFSPNGKIYLSSDGRDGEHGIYCFQRPTGKLLGRIGFEIHQFPEPENEEAEGITFCPMEVAGVRTHLHFVLLDKDVPSLDDVHFKSYQVVDPHSA